MRQFGNLLFALLVTALLFSTALCDAAVSAGANSAQAAGEPSIPVSILGKTIELRKGMTRSEAKTAMSAVIKDEASVDSAERLQYDIQLVPNRDPVTICFDFDGKGLSGFLLDSMEKKSNPAAVKLLDWLKANAGKPTVRKKGSTTWAFGGWKIEHQEGGSGEDSMYRVELTRAK